MPPLARAVLQVTVLTGKPDSSARVCTMAGVSRRLCTGGGLRGACHRAALRADPLADAAYGCYKGFGSFGLTKPPTTPVGVMRPVTPHSRQSCRQILQSYMMGEPFAKPVIFPKLKLMGLAMLHPSCGLSPARLSNLAAGTIMSI
jgi:hypothetical protein